MFIPLNPDAKQDFNSTYNWIAITPSWLSWLERQSHNLKVVSSSLTEGIFYFFYSNFCISLLLYPLHEGAKNGILTDITTIDELRINEKYEIDRAISKIAALQVSIIY